MRARQIQENKKEIIIHNFDKVIASGLPTLAADYAQIAASGLGLSSIRIWMFDEKKVQDIFGINLRPPSILWISYTFKKKSSKSRRKLKELIEVIE